MGQPVKIGRFTIASEIGRGAMGVVYEAVDPVLERTVAIKTINMALYSQDLAQYEKRFILEARAAGSLNHANIVTIYDVGRSGELAYMAMELLDGVELQDMISSNQLTAERALGIAAQVADGLAYAHERGVVHRDIKPANIMVLAGDHVKITDFGIARIRTGEAQTQSGVILGSPRYVSPEQILRKAGDARSDIFSLGVIVYEMVAGEPPFDGADVNAIMYQIVNVQPPPPSVANPELPEMLDLIVAKALAKNPDERYTNAAELAVDLRACRRQGASTTATAPVRAPAAGETATITAELFVDTVPVSDSETMDSSVPSDGSAEHRLARAFDSTQAVKRLAAGEAALVHATASEPSYMNRASGGIGDVPAKVESARDTAAARRIHAKPWSRRDRKLFLFAVIGALALGAAITLI